MLKLILASESPRRKKLLLEAGFNPHVFPVNISEYLEKNLTLEQQILRIAERKADAAFELYNPLESEHFLILTADTMVIYDGLALGKPQDTADAEKTLGLLSGKKHEVKTAICFIEGFGKNKILKKTSMATTEVHFRLILRHEISAYVATGSPMDKAGSYGIQDQAGQFVDKIVGDFDNVVGLPIKLVEKMIFDNGWKLERKSHVS